MDDHGPTNVNFDECDAVAVKRLQLDGEALRNTWVSTNSRREVALNGERYA